jgi:acetyltransferase-like isoleucine patch superfamily enzyme
VKEFEKPGLIPVETLKSILADCGENVRVYCGCRIHPPELVSIGSGSQIDENVRIVAGKSVNIGKHVHFAFDSSILGGGRCMVGDYVSIGVGVRLITGSEILSEGSLMNPTIPAEFRGVIRSSVAIERFATVFTGSVVFPGITIGEGAVVSAGSIVRRDLRPWVIYAGDPLVAVGRRNGEHVMKTAERLSCIDRGE